MNLCGKMGVMDLTTPEGVIEYMKQATSDEDWDRRCNKVKRANGGYPSFWFPAVVSSGLYEQVSGSKPGLTLINIDADGNEIPQGTWHAVTGEQIA